MPSKVPDVIDYLVALFTGAAGIGGAGVNVIDGPKVNASPGPLALWVGVDDITNVAGMPSAATSAQTLAGLGSRAEERLVVYCAVQAYSGSDDVRTQRAAAYGVVAAAETAIAGDPGLGGNVAARPAVTGVTLRQGPTDRGMTAQVIFSVDATALTEP